MGAACRVDVCRSQCGQLRVCVPPSRVAGGLCAPTGQLQDSRDSTRLSLSGRVELSPSRPGGAGRPDRDPASPQERRRVPVAAASPPSPRPELPRDAREDSRTGQGSGSLMS